MRNSKHTISEDVRFEVESSSLGDTYPLYVYPQDSFTLTLEFKAHGAVFSTPDAVEAFRALCHERLDRQVDRIRVRKP